MELMMMNQKKDSDISKLRKWSNDVLTGATNMNAKGDDPETENSGEEDEDEIDDSGYFGTYAHHAIHDQMLKVPCPKRTFNSTSNSLNTGQGSNRRLSRLYLQ